MYLIFMCLIMAYLTTASMMDVVLYIGNRQVQISTTDALCVSTDPDKCRLTRTPFIGIKWHSHRIMRINV